MRIQTVFRNALALCQAAQLSNLKAFDKKVADELLSADRKLWSALSHLLTQQWSLDDALHKMTHMRNDTHALLQLRPKIVRAAIAPPPCPAAPRGRGTKRERGRSSPHSPRDPPARERREKASQKEPHNAPQTRAVLRTCVPSWDRRRVGYGCLCRRRLALHALHCQSRRSKVPNQRRLPPALLTGRKGFCKQPYTWA